MDFDQRLNDLCFFPHCGFFFSFFCVCFQIVPGAFFLFFGLLVFLFLFNFSLVGGSGNGSRVVEQALLDPMTRADNPDDNGRCLLGEKLQKTAGRFLSN